MSIKISALLKEIWLLRKLVLEPLSHNYQVTLFTMVQYILLPNQRGFEFLQMAAKCSLLGLLTLLFIPAICRFCSFREENNYF